MQYFSVSIQTKRGRKLNCYQFSFLRVHLDANFQIAYKKFNSVQFFSVTLELLSSFCVRSQQHLIQWRCFSCLLSTLLLTALTHENSEATSWQVSQEIHLQGNKKESLGLICKRLYFCLPQSFRHYFEFVIII